jgi:hypothetical protein
VSTQQLITHLFPALVVSEQPALLSEAEIKRLKREKGHLFYFQGIKVESMAYFFFFIIEYRETVNLGLKAEVSSSSGKPSSFFKEQLRIPILNGRPLEHTGPPITIYDRSFSFFLENFKNVDLTIPPEIMEWVIEVISAATDR